METSPQYSLLLALLPLLLPAVYFDLRYFRIPNALCLAGCLGGLLYSLAMGGHTQLLLGLLGLLAAFAITVPFWLFGWLGAGDVKLASALGAFVGWPLILKALACIAFAGLLLAVLALLWHSQLGSVLARLNSSLRSSVALRSPVYLPATEAEGRIRLPYAIAIATGGMSAVWMFT